MRLRVSRIAVGLVAATILGVALPAGTASASVSPIQITKSFGASTIPLNGTTSLTLSLFNPDESVAQTGVAFTDSLPAGLVVATPNGLSTTCSGTVTATAGTGTVQLTGGSLAATGVCNITVNVVGTTAGTMNNSVTVSSTEGGTGTTGNASLVVVAPPSIAKAFVPLTIPLNGTTTLTFTITNPNGSTALSGVEFSDTFPSGLVVATPNGLTNSCGGTATATAGSATVTLTGGSIAANGNCTLAVNVTGTSAGVKNNQTGDVSSTEGGTGNAASASVTVLVGPPTVAKAFGAPTIPLNGTTTLTLTITNPNVANSLSGIAFTDTFPSGLVVATPSNLTNTCGGTATATPGSTSVSLTGGSLVASGSCVVSLKVTGTTTGTETNSVKVSASDVGSGNTATATLTVVTPTAPGASTAIVAPTAVFTG